MFGPARQFCRDVVEEIDRAPADLVVVDVLIPAALSGAEAAGVPSVLLMHGTYLLPRAGAPPFGMGFLPARGSLGQLRDRAAWSLTMALFRTGMPALNQARAELGLAPLRNPDELAATAERIHAGAGLRVRKNASTAALQAAIGRVLDDDRYRAGAQRMAAVLAAERDDALAVDELERAAARNGAPQRADRRSRAPRNCVRRLRGNAAHRSRPRPRVHAKETTRWSTSGSVTPG